MPAPFNKQIQESLDRFRHRLSFQDAVPQLVLLGIAGGLLASVLIVLFRLLVEGVLSELLSGAPERFEALSIPWRFGLPLGGALLIGLILHFMDNINRAVGVTHVLERLHNHQGRLPGKNLILQFFSGTIALVSGQSVGREGPGIHLGAGAASLLGQWFDLPNNSLRTLVACGAAAAISASFNTPMAGVIFAMEVILMEYTITGFIPVIVASVLGAVVTRFVFGTESIFALNAVEFSGLWEIPFMVLAGLLFSIVAMLFIRLQLFFFKWQSRPVLLRMLVIGCLTGLVAIWLPQVMGAGYDTLNLAINGGMGIGLLLGIVAAKLAVTALASGLGMTGGLIGPLLVMGGCLGAVIGVVGNQLLSDPSSSAFYVVLGMVAMMGAVLNAPLAALVAILELSNSADIIFPSMLMVVVACVSVQQFFRLKGIYAEQLGYLGHKVYAEPTRQFLSRIGVRSVMRASLRTVSPGIELKTAQEIVASGVLWLVIETDEDLKLLSTADLAKHLESDQKSLTANDDMIDLMKIAARILKLVSIDAGANLYEASRLIKQTGADALCVTQQRISAVNKVGILTKDSIQNYYGI